MPWVFGFVLKWHDNSELSHLGNASAKFSDQEEFQSWIVNFQVEVCAKAKNLALVLQWIKRSKQPVHWRTSSIHNQLREKVSQIMKNWIWWWRQDWNGATMLFIWTTKLPSVEPWQDKRAKNSHTERKTRRMLSAENKWVLFKKGTLVVFYTLVPRETVRITWNEVEMCKKFSSRSKHPLQYRKWKTQIDGKSLNSLKGSPATKAENSLSVVGKMKNIAVWSSTSSRVSWLQVLKQMHSWLSLLVSTCWRWAETSARGRDKNVLKEQLLFWKQNVQGCEELGLNASAGTHLKFSGCIWYKIELVKGKGNLEALSKKVNLMSEIFARLVLRDNHVSKPHDKQILPAK